MRFFAGKLRERSSPAPLQELLTHGCKQTCLSVCSLFQYLPPAAGSHHPIRPTRFVFRGMDDVLLYNRLVNKARGYLPCRRQGKGAYFSIGRAEAFETKNAEVNRLRPLTSAPKVLKDGVWGRKLLKKFPSPQKTYIFMPMPCLWAWAR